MIIRSKNGKFIILAQEFFHHDELEITHNIIAAQAFITACDIHFALFNQVFHHFTEHEVDLGSILNPSLNSTRMISFGMICSTIYSQVYGSSSVST